MLAQLPVELLEHVLQYSGEGDKMNIACCNRQHSELMKPLLWQRMRIRMKKDLLSPELHPAVIEHAHYTREITLVIENSFIYPQDDRLNVNVSCLLDALDVEKVTILKINEFVFEMEETGPSFPILRMLPLPSLKRLELISTNECYDLEEDCDNWSISHVPKTLTQLSICESEFSAQFFQTIMDSNQSLSSLIVDQWDSFSNDNLIVIGRSINLTSLSLSQLGTYPSNFDFTVLRNLQKLETFKLFDINIGPSPLLVLWQGLFNLTRLDLIYLNLSNQAFSGLSALQNLEKLVVLSCSEITSNCFVTAVGSLEKLKFLKFDVELFKDIMNEDQDEWRLAVNHLNNLPCLSRVTIDSEGHEHSSRILRCFCGTVKKWIVTLDYEENPEGNYVLHKL